MNTQLDDKFKQIKGLAWLPWVGDKYFNILSENRILIIGESYYGGGNDLAEKKIFFENVLKTREFVEEMGIEGINSGTRLFPNLHTTLFPNQLLKNDEKRRERFWQLVSFYNFVQKPMLTRVDRPNDFDFCSGWLTFIELFKLLNPRICLFIGITSAKYFENEVSNIPELKAAKVEWHNIEINGTYARYTTIILNNSKSELIFIKHTSKYYSPIKWNDFLKTKMSNQLQWLENEII
jgi:hypothetical protein